MFKRNRPAFLGLILASLALTHCKVPQLTQQTENKSVPSSYSTATDSANTAAVSWRSFFSDPYLASLIDTALKRNQELQITLQEIEIAKNEVLYRQGPLRPSVAAKLGIGVDKVGRYTSQGAGDASTEIKPGKEVPDALTDFTGALYARWEIDIWKKLQNAKKAAIARYLSSVEGRNFVRTNLIAEVAGDYYELLALDNELAIVRQNIALQNNALEIVKVQKEAARATELAVQKFDAEVSKSKSLEFDLLQQIRETENHVNFLLGRFPQEIPRSRTDLLTAMPQAVKTGIPSQLLANRPDVRQAELDLEAAKLDVKVARAEFYPSFEISAALGFQAFKPAYLMKLPESMLYSLAGDLAGPIINRSAIKAEFYTANAKQVQAIYNYERTILNAYVEVSTQLSRIDNLAQRYAYKDKQVTALTRSIDISNDLFKSAKADYLEVLLTQRDALEAKLELVETRKDQLNALVTVYRALGGGWK